MIEAINILENRVGIIEKELDDLKKHIQAFKNTLSIPQPVATPAAVPVITPMLQPTEFEQLKKLLESNAWPPAVNPNLICDISSDQDREDRAEGILNIIIDTDLRGLKFLDFGCGEGHVVTRTKLQEPEIAIGYDIVESPKWLNFSTNKTKYTTNWEEVLKNGPYDILLLYDVIDHITDEDPVEVLRRLKSVLKPNTGKAFIRAHPFSSRHATHLYYKLNKAFIHLVFNDSELESMGLVGQKINRILHPLKQYNDMFTKAGFRLLRDPQIQKEPVEPFFNNTPIVVNRIKPHWFNSHEEPLRKGEHFPIFQCEQQFLDYILA